VEGPAAAISTVVQRLQTVRQTRTLRFFRFTIMKVTDLQAAGAASGNINIRVTKQPVLGKFITT
jgi:hypothetical protein